MKTKMIILIIAFISHSACTTVNDAQENISQIEENNEVIEVFTHAQWAYYENLDELFQRATDVVRVEVLDDGACETVNIRLPDINNKDWKPFYTVYTLYEVKVIETYKGRLANNNTIMVGQRGGETDRIRLVSDAFVPLKAGDDLTLFITIHEGIYHANLLTPWDAVYRIETEDGTRISSDTRASDDHKLVPVYERGHLSFTIGELRNYRAKEE
ncbi:MAG: hypothetical protein LBC96_00475 [Lachnospiraceae bacterium]|jgi:hypothetical protein|nr:hypothetical protein [Lachnospiraceae bacterium]